MDSGRVLLALKEREKWRDRRERLRNRLRSVQARKRYLQRELDALHGRAAHLEEVLAGQMAERAPAEHAYVAYDHVRR